MFSKKLRKRFGTFRKTFCLCNQKIVNGMERLQVIDSIKQVAARVLPKGSILYLYGSRARGDYREGSDWDLLLLLDKPKLEKGDFDK